MASLINYTCAHGLQPGPYADWGNHQAEHLSLLDRSGSQLGCTHLNFPTEAMSQFRSAFSFDKIAWFCQQSRARGIVPVIWMDKWLWIQDAGVVQAWLQNLVTATWSYQPVYNLAQEVDYLWVTPEGAAAGQDAGLVLSRLGSGIQTLESLGVPREAMWAGGATFDGAVRIDQALRLPTLTWTWYQAAQDALRQDRNGGTVYQTIAGELARLRSARVSSGPLVAAELGWPASLAGQDGQASILAEGLRACLDQGVMPGLWTLCDWTAEDPGVWQQDPASPTWGALTAAGGEKPLAVVWRNVVSGGGGGAVIPPPEGGGSVPVGSPPAGDGDAAGSGMAALALGAALAAGLAALALSGRGGGGEGRIA